ncbi:MAG: ABC transporter permease [Bryobacterales bacterium]|nr:ABC transporter permease [Bryobacterales bacterium]
MAAGLARTWLQLTQYLLPAQKRRAWREEWLAELEHRRSVPFTRLAENILRDALFTRSRVESSETFRRPLRLEAAAFCAATLLWLLFGLPAPKRPAGQHLERVAFVQRTYAAMGISLSTVTLRLQGELRHEPWVEAVGAFRVRYGFTASAQVSRDFFETLGVRPVLGRTLQAAPLDHAVLTHAMWQDEFHGDRGVIGRVVLIEDRRYIVAGVLPENFAFVSKRLRYFVPLPEGTPGSGVVIRRVPGLPIEEAERKLLALAPGLVHRLHPFLQTPRWQDTLSMALAIAVLALTGGVVYLHRKLRATPRSCAVLALRLLLSTTALAQVSVVAARILSENLLPAGIWHIWLFTMACCILAGVTLRDHLGRCPECFEQLRSPARIGTWSSLVVEAPATETVCPNGHGLMHRDETGERRSRWTSFDESWRSLFGKRIE